MSDKVYSFVDDENRENTIAFVDEHVIDLNGHLYVKETAAPTLETLESWYDDLENLILDLTDEEYPTMRGFWAKKLRSVNYQIAEMISVLEK